MVKFDKSFWKAVGDLGLYIFSLSLLLKLGIPIISIFGLLLVPGLIATTIWLFGRFFK